MIVPPTIVKISTADIPSRDAPDPAAAPSDGPVAVIVPLTIVRFPTSDRPPFAKPAPSDPVVVMFPFQITILPTADVPRTARPEPMAAPPDIALALMIPPRIATSSVIESNPTAAADPIAADPDTSYDPLTTAIRRHRSDGPGPIAGASSVPLASRKPPRADRAMDAEAAHAMAGEGELREAM
jgi:hypothetical protein